MPQVSSRLRGRGRRTQAVPLPALALAALPCRPWAHRCASCDAAGRPMRRMAFRGHRWGFVDEANVRALGSDLALTVVEDGSVSCVRACASAELGNDPFGDGSGGVRRAVDMGRDVVLCRAPDAAASGPMCGEKTHRLFHALWRRSTRAATRVVGDQTVVFKRDIEE